MERRHVCLVGAHGASANSTVTLQSWRISFLNCARRRISRRLYVNASANCRGSPSITRSWKRRTAFLWWRPISTGTTSVVGGHCRIILRKTNRATPRIAPSPRLDSSNNIVFEEDGTTIALLGVHDLIVVRTKDALLVCHRHEAEKIKNLIGKLAAGAAMSQHAVNPILALDFGRARIGAAISDELQLLAHPLETIPANKQAPLAHRRNRPRKKSRSRRSRHSPPDERPDWCCSN